jgi:hypothetical protein
MSDLSGVLLFVLGFAGCVVALAGIILPPLPPRETLTDRWRKLSDEVPR